MMLDYDAMALMNITYSVSVFTQYVQANKLTEFFWGGDPKDALGLTPIDLKNGSDPGTICTAPPMVSLQISLMIEYSHKWDSLR